MSKNLWKVDENGIFLDGQKKNIFYPKNGNMNCFQIEDNSPWFNQRNDLIIELIKKHNLNGNFLDIGGGNGFQLIKISTLEIISNTFLVEPGYDGCKNAIKRGLKNVYCGYFENFNFLENNINICGLFDVIEHIEDDIKFLNDLFEKIPLNNHVIINVPALKFLWSNVDIGIGHYRRYNTKDLVRIENNTKFKIIDSGFYFRFYFLAMFFLRVLPFRLGFPRSVEKESKNHKKTGILQRFINKRHDSQIKKIKYNKNFFYGTSMFIVLKKE